MIFNKSLLSACIIAQALMQISFSANVPRIKAQSYTGPAVTHSVNVTINICNENGTVAICNENGCSTTLKKNNNDGSKCTDGTTRCASEGIDSETCSNGKWILRKCSANEECKIDKDNIAKCTKIDESKCTDGTTRCASQAKCTKIDESKCTDGTTRCASQGIDSETCSNGKWIRRKCSGNEECKIDKDNIAKCTKISPP
ncbi:hypothetical protein BB561_006937 [Smittium simulii]|uniref:Uncharacterized protein n=1 Tax=Smittium simulii TaxID=133385 RepID=A0A2T9XZJ4_9FUNG|nr:hypothetical protein BB561_006937 [Smittium simulii]